MAKGGGEGIGDIPLGAGSGSFNSILKMVYCFFCLTSLRVKNLLLVSYRVQNIKRTLSASSFSIRK